jgi:integrase/recombinase XerC
MKNIIDQYKAALNGSPTNETYKASLVALEQFYQDRDGFQVEDISEYHQYLLEQEYSDNTARLYTSVMRKLLKWSVVKELLNANDVVRAEAYYDTIGQQRSGFKRRQINEDDIKKLSGFFEPSNPDDLIYMRNRALVRLLLGTGLRITEALNLDRQPFDEFFGNWNGRRELVLPILGKGKKIRDMIILPEYLKPIQEYLSLRTDRYPALFCSHANRAGEDGRISRKTAYKVFQDVAELLNLKSFISPHALRHFFSETLMERGMALEDLQDLLGHANPATTKRSYAGVAKTKRLARIRRQFEEGHEED